MQELKTTPVRSHPLRPVHINKALATCIHIFVRHDAVRKPLQTPYDGPYEVLERSRKHFVIDIKGKRDTISLDRLKSAHLDNNIDLETNITPSVAPPVTTESQSTMPTRVTRSGRHVQYPVRFSK